MLRDNYATRCLLFWYKGYKCTKRSSDNNHVYLSTQFAIRHHCCFRGFSFSFLCVCNVTQENYPMNSCCQCNHTLKEKLHTIFGLCNNSTVLFGRRLTHKLHRCCRYSVMQEYIYNSYIKNIYIKYPCPKT